MRIKAFTLVELIIALVVISIAIISVTLMYEWSLRGSVNTRALTVATALAEEKMDEVLKLGYSGISNFGPTIFPAPFSDYRFQVVVHYVNASDLNTPVDPSQTDYKNVEVSIMHNKIATITANSLLVNYQN